MTRFVSVVAVAGLVLTTAGLSAQQESGESPVLDAASRALAVESVASTVEQNYPWPDTARMIAAHHTLDEVPGPRRLDVPLYVLVDRGSGSAGEVAPFVLQNLGRATIVGARTAGAGRSASFLPAELGLTVSVSSSQLYDESSGRVIERIGVLPDIVTTSEDALATALEHAHETIRVARRSGDRHSAR